MMLLFLLLEGFDIIVDWKIKKKHLKLHLSFMPAYCDNLKIKRRKKKKKPHKQRKI